MGLAASQGRMLMLTAQKADINYQIQDIMQKRLVLNQSVTALTQEYNEAMSNTVLQTDINGKTQRLTYDILTAKDPFSGLGLRLADKYGNVVVPGECIEMQKKELDEETGEETVSYKGLYASAADFIKDYMPELSDDKKTELAAYSLSEICEYYNTAYDNKDSAMTAVHKNKSSNPAVLEGETTLTDYKLNDPAYIQQMILSGEYKLQQPQADGTYQDFEWQGSTLIREVLDESDDAAAQAKYDAGLAELQQIDKTYDLELQRLETSLKAVTKEHDSVKEQIKGNVEGSFSTFT